MECKHGILLEFHWKISLSIFLLFLYLILSTGNKNEFSTKAFLKTMKELMVIAWCYIID